MAIPNVIGRGIGFSPGSVKFIPDMGFLAQNIVPAVVNISDIYSITIAGKGQVTTISGTGQVTTISITGKFGGPT